MSLERVDSFTHHISMADNESNKIAPWFDNPHSTESISSNGVRRCAGCGVANQCRAMKPSRSLSLASDGFTACPLNRRPADLRQIRTRRTTVFFSGLKRRGKQTGKTLVLFPAKQVVSAVSLPQEADERTKPMDLDRRQAENR